VTAVTEKFATRRFAFINTRIFRTTGLIVGAVGIAAGLFLLLFYAPVGLRLIKELSGGRCYAITSGKQLITLKDEDQLCLPDGVAWYAQVPKGEDYIVFILGGTVIRCKESCDLDFDTGRISVTVFETPKQSSGQMSAQVLVYATTLGQRAN
jgi:hypothetical protein